MKRGLTKKNEMINWIQWWLPLLVLMSPMLLWPLEQILPYPVLVEELFKVGLVVLVLRNVPEKVQLRLVWVLGLLFGLSESFLFLVNASLLWSLEPFFWRLVATVPMHMMTILIIYRMGKKGKLGLVLGAVLGMGIHHGFNVLVGS